MPSVLTESGWGAAWGIELTPIARREEHQDEYIAEVDAWLAGKEELPPGTRGSSSPVIDSLVTGTREAPLNLPNAGHAPTCRRAVVESMCVVDDDGIRGRDVRAPAPFAELLRRHVAVQEMTVEAALAATGRWPLRPSPSTRWPAAATCATPRPWSRSCSPAPPMAPAVQRVRRPGPREGTHGLGFVGLGAWASP